MERLTRSIRCAAFAGALGVAATCAGTQQVLAQAQQPAAENPTAAAKRAYEGGVKAFGAGRHQNAVDQFNVALRGGGLSSAEMAKSLYYRGVSYKKLNKPGLAISDLTSALWLKNGLSDADRAGAEAARAEAYKAAGVAEGSAPVAARSGPPEAARATEPAAGPAGTPAAPASAPVMSDFQPSAQQAATGGGGGIPQPLTMGNETAVPELPRYARSETSGTINHAAALDQPTSVASNYVSNAAATQAAPASTQSSPVEPAVTAAPMNEGIGSTSEPSAGGALAGVSGFFSNIFGGNSASSPSQAPEAFPTASTYSAPPGAPQTSSWSWSASTTGGSANKIAAPKPAAAPVQTAALSPQSVPQAPTVKGGKYKIHVAAVRSRAEAEALAQRLNAEHGKALSNRIATVDEATIGSMGKFYRVRVGSYPTADEPRGLCNTLRNSGYDCLVVTN